MIPHPASADTKHPQNTPERIVLTGFMGAGKTTVGRLLAASLGWHFADLDHAIEHAAGRSVPQIFRENGEPALRRLESHALARLLGQGDTVIALGGGAPETLTNRLLLEQTPATVTVALVAPFPVLYDRCILQTPAGGVGPLADQLAAFRPNLADPAEAEARFDRRRALYRRIAHHTVDVTSASPQAVAAHVCSLLRLSADAAISSAPPPAACIQLLT